MSRTWLAAVFVSALVACGDKFTGVVVVIDGAGKPVIGATVTPIANAIAGAPNLTNENGEAHLDTPNDAPPLAVTISKGGFVDARASIPKEWPLRITLRRIADVR